MIWCISFSRSGMAENNFHVCVWQNSFHVCEWLRIQSKGVILLYMSVDFTLRNQLTNVFTALRTLTTDLSSMFTTTETDVPRPLTFIITFNLDMRTYSVCVCVTGRASDSTKLLYVRKQRKPLCYMSYGIIFLGGIGSPPNLSTILCTALTTVLSSFSTVLSW